MSHLAILGASGHGKVIADTAYLNSDWDLISFFDDSWETIAFDSVWPLIGNTEDLLANLNQFSGVMVGIGDNSIRQIKHNLLVKNGASMATIVHPQSYISGAAVLGAGSVVFAQAVVNVNVCIGAGVIINTGSTVDHDCLLSDFVHVSPGANLGGDVQVGQRSWLGIGCAVRQGISIGNDVVVGAGSVVVSQVQDNLTVVGVPARSLNTKFH